MSISLAGRLGVLDGVVQHGRHDGRVVEPQLGQQRRDLEGMRHIGVARGALLRAMRLHGVDIGAVEQRLVGVRVVTLDPLDEFVLPHHAGGAFQIVRVRGSIRSAHIGDEPAAPQARNEDAGRAHARRPQPSP